MANSTHLVTKIHPCITHPKHVEIPCKSLRKTTLKSLFKIVYNFLTHTPTCVNHDLFADFFPFSHRPFHIITLPVNTPFFHYSTAPITSTTKLI